MKGNLKSRLKKGDHMLGTALTITSPEISEILSQVGFDWLWIDMEHGPFDLTQTQRMIQAMRPGCASVVRTPWNDSVWIKRILDIGCEGLIVPQIKTAAEAEAAVRACKYPPDGIRSVAVARANNYGLTFEDYMKLANEDTAIILQVEHEEGVMNIDTITKTKGIDAIMVGPYDLSASLGLIGQVRHPKVKDAIDKVKSECLDRGLAVAIVADSPQLARDFMEEGFSMVGLGVDCIYLWMAAKQAISETWKNQGV
jgi:2-keto-3-deoxy-L-rhamnonate aldolase RhmA